MHPFLGGVCCQFQTKPKMIVKCGIGQCTILSIGQHNKGWGSKINNKTGWARSATLGIQVKLVSVSQ